MRDTTRQDDDITWMDVEDFIGAPDAEMTFADIEHLVFLVMDVQGNTFSGRNDFLKKSKPSAGIGTPHP
ncbi:hypothetical protein ROS1_51240 [Roseibium sp. ROS1]